MTGTGDGTLPPVRSGSSEREYLRHAIPATLRQAIDCQHMPVSHADFNRMSCFGADKLRAAVIVFAAPVDDHACASADRPQDSLP